jgi:hypothetical protein
MITEKRQGGTLAVLGLSLLYVVITVQQSLDRGQLALPVTYDDISYFLDAARRLQLLYLDGPLALLDGWLQNPPHSPMATLKSLIAFLVFGIQDWAPAAANVLVLAGVLLALDRTLLTGLSSRGRLFLLLIILSWPIFSFLVIESRPDIITGFLLAFGAFLAVMRPWLGSSLRHIAAVSAIFGFALLWKPSYLPVTLGVFGLSLLAATLIDLGRSWTGNRIIAALRTGIVAGALMVAFALPHFAINARHTVRYIYTTLFGAEKDLWSLKISQHDHAVFYLWGEGGWSLMNIWLFVALATFVVATLRMLVRDRAQGIRQLALLAVYTVVWAAITLSASKTVFLGAVVGWSALFLFIIAIRQLLSLFTEHRVAGPVFRSGLVITLSAVAITAFTWHWPSRNPTTPPVARDLADRRQVLISDVAKAIMLDQPSDARVYFPVITDYLNADILSFALVKRQASGSVAFDGHRLGDLPLQLERMKEATHLVLFSEDDFDLIRWLPSFGVLPAISSHLSSDTSFGEISRFDAPLGGGSIRLLSRNAAFRGLKPLSGLLPLEGPYPQWDLPTVRWGTDSKAVLKLTGPQGEGHLYLRARSPFPGQMITIHHGAQELGRCDLGTPNVFIDCEAPVDALPKGAILELRFRHADDPATGGRAVLFTSLRIRR